MAKHAGGRPTKYDPKLSPLVEALCEFGATDQELADVLEIDVGTLYRWKNNYPEFCKVLKVGKEQADNRVERSLYSRANGYEHDDVDIKVIDGKIVKTKLRKYYPPDTTAGIFWLKNRRRDDWRDQSNIDHTTKGKELPTPILGGVSAIPVDNSNTETPTAP